MAERKPKKRKRLSLKDAQHLKALRELILRAMPKGATACGVERRRGKLEFYVEAEECGG